MEIGKNLRKIRELKGYSQENMAMALGISQRQYCRWETEETPLNTKKIEKLSKILEIAPIDIMCFDKKNIFHRPNNKENAGYSNRNFLQELKEQYEIQIKLVKEQNDFLKQEIASLRKQMEGK